MMKRWLSWGAKRKPISESRWVVIDVETTGLDPSHDDLLCIAGVAMRRDAAGWTLDHGDHFQVVLKQAVHRASETNVLLHGIGWGAQQQGRPRAEALGAFQSWVGDALLVAHMVIGADLDGAGVGPLRRVAHQPREPMRVRHPTKRSRQADPCVGS